MRRKILPSFICLLTATELLGFGSRPPKQGAPEKKATSQNPKYYDDLFGVEGRIPQAVVAAVTIPANPDGLPVTAKALPLDSIKVYQKDSTYSWRTSGEILKELGSLKDTIALVCTYSYAPNEKIVLPRLSGCTYLPRVVRRWQAEGISPFAFALSGFQNLNQGIYAQSSRTAGMEGFVGASGTGQVAYIWLLPNLVAGYEIAFPLDFSSGKDKTVRKVGLRLEMPVVTDPALLEKIALGEKAAEHDWTLKRRVEIKNITDETALSELVASEKNPLLRTTATDRLADLRDTAARNLAASRADAIGKITDQALLLKIAWEDEEPVVRRAAVENLTDQAALAKIAFENSAVPARIAAAARLTDQAQLAKIVIEDKEWGVRYAAIRGIRDQGLLVTIAERTGFTPAIERLTDQAVLARIALGHPNMVPREAAVRTLTDQSVLAKIVVEERWWPLRKLAMMKLTDLALLEKIAEGNENWEVKDFARARLRQLRR